MRKIAFLAIFLTFLSGCSWNYYKGCAIFPTDTDPRYTSFDVKDGIITNNVSQEWWEYKKGEFGFWFKGYEVGNAPWWAYPKDIFVIPIQGFCVIVNVLNGNLR